MKRRLLHNISFQAAQLFLNQSLSLLVFFILSRQLSKTDFGEINWTLAVFLTAFSSLSFGLEQVVIRKIARNEQIASIISVYIFHVLLSGCIFYGSLLLIHLRFPLLLNSSKVFFLIGLGKLLLFFSTPFKQLSIGTEKFNLLLYMSVPSNILKGVLLSIFLLTNHLTLQNAVISFAVADFSELIVCILLFKFFIKLPIFNFQKREYRRLLKEALPQLGVNLFSSGLARFDWIFIGLYLSSMKLAEYSFAYKAFELSTIPLLIIAPILIPAFTKLQAKGKPVNEEPRLLLLLELAFAIACFVALIVNLGWIPITNLLSLSKYGAVNRTTVFFLSICMLVLYLNNFLWTHHFASGNLKMIFRIFAFTFLVNLAGDILLIPIFENKGAALAYLLALAVQAFLYLRKTPVQNIINPKRFFLYIFSSLSAGLISEKLFQSDWGRLCASLIIYLCLYIIIRRFRRYKLNFFKEAVSTQGQPV